MSKTEQITSPVPPRDAAAAPQIDERYRIEKEIGRGGMGRVFVAHDHKLGRDVAIKVLATGLHGEETLHRFEREARATCALNHANILDVHDIGMHEGNPYIVSELLHGSTLRERLARGPLSVQDASGYVLQFAEGLSAAHEKGIVHRDLKPENLFITDEGRLKILDFGIARLVAPMTLETGETLPSPQPHTEEGAILGTVGYMSPEQVRGQPADQRSDVFAFGAIFHEMLAGNSPFERDTAVETGAAILNDAPPPLPAGVPAGLVRIVRRCLAKRPEDRFESARDLVDVLRAGLEQARTPGRFYLRALGASAVLTLVALTVFGWRLRTRGEARANSIAVLPFADMSPSKDQEYFSDGIAEEILNVLAQVDGLRVIGRTSSFSMKGKNEDLRTIGQRLGATNLLEGSVRKSGARVRINAQLVEAEGGSRLWSQEFDRELTDVFAVQEEIAHAVVDALKVKLLPAAREETRGRHSLGPSRAVNPEAYDLYLRGRALFARGSGDAYDRAVEVLRKSVALDPGFAQAWAALAEALYQRGDFSVKGDPNAERPEALVAAEKAIALAPQRADGYAARGVLRTIMLQDWSGARADLERARSLNPRSPDILLNDARLLAALGRLTEAISVCQQAAVLDPLSADVQYILNTAYLGAGQLALAEAAATRALEISPEHGRAARNLGITLLLRNRIPEARAAFHRSSHAFVIEMGNVMVEHSLGHSAESQRGSTASSPALTSKWLRIRSPRCTRGAERAIAPSTGWGTQPSCTMGGSPISNTTPSCAACAATRASRHC